LIDQDDKIIGYLTVNEYLGDTFLPYVIYDILVEAGY
jgi:hypothetical protein